MKGCGLLNEVSPRGTAFLREVRAKRACTLAVRAMAMPLIALAIVVQSSPARAALGADVKTVEADRQQIRATKRITSHATYSVHELQSAGGALVREYVSAGGVVFAVSWGGSTMPNLRQLLGAHFDSFVSSTNQQRGGHGHLVVHEGKLVVESGGHMRSFHGRAYLSDAVPSGVVLDEIQ